MQAETASNVVALRSRSADPLRKSGVAGVADFPWGTHFCLFYASIDELLEVIAPYFAAGLAANERCLWIAPEPLTAAAARTRLAALIPDLDAGLAAGRIDIRACADWYRPDGAIDRSRLMADALATYDAALRDGYEGLRAVGSVLEVSAADWPVFMTYEADLDAAHVSRRLLTLCAYALRARSATALLDAVARHQFALIRRGEKWRTIHEIDEAPGASATENPSPRSDDRAPESVVFTLDAQGRLSGWSEDVTRLTGWTREAMAGVLSRIPEERRAVTLEGELNAALAKGLDRRRGALARGDRSTSASKTTIAALRDDKGEPRGFAVTITDLRERMRVEQEREAGEALLRAIVDGAVDAIVAVDEGGAIRMLNAAAARLFGYEPAEAIGGDIDMFFAEPVGGDGRFFERRRACGTARIGVARERVGRRKDGALFPIELTISETARNGDRLFIVFLRDLSERHRVEARMRKLRADQLDHLAQMAAGVAHEINQPLSAISAYLGAARRLLRRRAAPGVGAALEPILDNAVAQVQRAARIVGQLRGFVTRAEPDKTLQSLHEVIRDAFDHADSDDETARLSITLDLAAASDRVIVDRAQIRMVLVNIKRNALEAMRDAQRRELVISTRLVEDGMIRADIADTGAGLAEEMANELFEPFITTKTHGLGFGLPVSRAIVEAHYGQLWAGANPGGGAVLSFTLPLAGDRLEEPVAEA